MATDVEIGSKVYDRLTREKHLDAAMKEMVNQDLYRLGLYCADLPTDGIPAVIGSMVHAEKIRRWDAQYVELSNGELGGTEKTIEDLPAGATAAEGMDLAMGREKLNN